MSADGMSDTALAAIRDRDESLYASRSARDLVHQDRHVLLQLLDEMTRCRDNAVRAAEREDVPVEFDLEGNLRDGLAGIAEWRDGAEPDQAPDWLIDAVVRVVRPELARLTQERDQLAETPTTEAAVAQLREWCPDYEPGATHIAMPAPTAYKLRDLAGGLMPAPQRTDADARRDQTGDAR